MRIDPRSSSLSSPSTMAATRVASSRRRSRVASLLALAAALVPLAASSPALAFCRSMTGVSPSGDVEPMDQCIITTGSPYYWASSNVGYRVSTAGLAEHGYDPVKVKAAIDRGFATWRSATCMEQPGKPSISLEDLGTTSNTAVGYKKGAANENLIVFNFDEPSPTGDIALTKVSVLSSTGEILDVDIEIFAKDKKFTVEGTPDESSFDLEVVIAHEAGHFLGFAHNYDEASLMYRDYSAEKKELSADDAAGICTVYPPDGKRPTAEGPLEAKTCGPGGPVCPEEFVAGCSASGAPGGSGAGFSLLTALGIAWAYRRRGRAAALR